MICDTDVTNIQTLLTHGRHGRHGQVPSPGWNRLNSAPLRPETRRAGEKNKWAMKTVDRKTKTICCTPWNTKKWTPMSNKAKVVLNHVQPKAKRESWSMESMSSILRSWKSGNHWKQPKPMKKKTAKTILGNTGSIWKHSISNVIKQRLAMTGSIVGQASLVQQMPQLGRWLNSTESMPTSQPEEFTAMVWPCLTNQIGKHVKQ